MTEFVCPRNPKHTLKSKDNDDRFNELTCVSCGTKVYKPKDYSQKPTNYMQDGTLMPESYQIVEEFQPDILDEEESFNLMCEESCKRYDIEVS